MNAAYPIWHRLLGLKLVPTLLLVALSFVVFKNDAGSFPSFPVTILIGLVGISIWRYSLHDVGWFKEIRSQLPIWIPAVWLSGAIPNIFHFPAMLSVFLPAVVMGHEYTHKTADMLHSSGISRSRLWWIKMSTAAFLSIAIGAVTMGFRGLDDFVEHCTPHQLWALLGGFLAAWTGASWHAQRTRSTLGGGILSLGVVLFLLAATASFHEFREWMSRRSSNTGDMNIEHAFPITALTAIYFTLAVVGAWRSHLCFVHYQSDAGAFQFLFGSRRFTGGSSADSSSATTMPHWIWLRNELRLHWPVILCMAVMTVLVLAAGGMIAINSPEARKPMEAYLVIPMVLIAPIVAILAGAISIAEERSLGTWAWQITQPRSRWVTWISKFAVSASLACLGAVVLPCLLYLGLGKVLGFHGHVGLLFDSMESANALLQSLHLSHATGALAVAAIIYAAGFFGSSIMPDTMRAISVAIGVLVLSGMACILALDLTPEVIGMRNPLHLSGEQAADLFKLESAMAARRWIQGMVSNPETYSFEMEGARKMLAVFWGFIALLGCLVVSSRINAFREWRPWRRAAVFGLFCIITLFVTVLSTKGTSPRLLVDLEIAKLRVWEMAKLDAMGRRGDAELFYLFGAPTEGVYFQLAFETFEPTTTRRRIHAAPTDDAREVGSTRSRLSHRMSGAAFPQVVWGGAISGWAPDQINRDPADLRYIALPTTEEDRAWILKNVAMPESLTALLSRKLP